MATQLRQTILEAKDIESEQVEVPEWGVTVEVRGMSAKERSKLLRASTGKDGNVDFQKWFPLLVIATTYDPDTGEQVFELADRDALNEKSGNAISLIAEVASRLSGLGDQNVEAAKERFPE